MTRWYRLTREQMIADFFRLKGAPMLPHVHVIDPSFILRQGFQHYAKCADCRVWVPAIN